jgi:hypothetical protein
MYIVVGHCVCLEICELGCEMGVNSGLIPIVIVIVIVIVSHFIPLFFSQKWHPNFGLFWYNIIDGRFCSAFALPSLCLRSGFALPPLLKWRQGGGKGYPKWEEKDDNLTNTFVG